MAARKKTTTKRTTTPRRRRRSAKKKEPSWKPALAAVAGGLGSAGAGYMLVRGGVSPMTAAVGLTAAGSVAMLTTQGNMQAASFGATGLGTGQLALALITDQATKADNTKQLAAADARKRAIAQIKKMGGVGGRNAGDFAGGIEDAFRQARDELSIDEEIAAFSDDYDDEDFA